MGVVGTAWALDAVLGAPSYTGRVLRQTNSVTLAGATTARPFGGVSGVRPGTSTVTVTSTSTTWTAQTFAGVIDLEASALSGAYEFAFNLVTSGSVTASNASNPRIDILSVRIDDPAEGDGTSVPAVTLVYTAGTAAGSPVAPATPARSFAIAQFNFPAGSGTTPTVTWVAPYTVAAGGIQPVPTTVYPASPYVGQYVDDAALGLLRWNGSTWVGVSAGRSRVIPTQTSTGGTVTVNSTTGEVAATGAVTQLNVTIPNATQYRAFEITYYMRGSTSGTYTLKLLNAGTPNATASSYRGSRLFDATSGALTPGTSWTPLVGGRIEHWRKAMITQLAQAKITVWNELGGSADAAANEGVVNVMARHTDPVALDGIRWDFTSMGTFADLSVTIDGIL